MTKKIPVLSAMAFIAAACAVTVPASPIPLDDHSYRSLNPGGHYYLERPGVAEPLDVHNISLQFSDRYYYSKDTSVVRNRWLLHFGDSINFRDIDFNFRIRLDSPGNRVHDAGWSSERAGEKNDPGFVYDPDRIVAHYTPSEYFRFGFGKDRYNWGPLELGGLLLSDYNEGLTGFYQQYALGGFVLRGVTSQLNSMVIDKVVTQRYFSAARLEYHKENYGAAFGQSMLYVGAGRSWEPQFFFPFFIFHYGQMGYNRGYGNAGQNSQGSMDGYCKVYKLPLEAYGELFVDDFQGHSDSVSQSVQNTVSWMAGLRLKGAEPWYGFIEGGKTSTYSYNHKNVPKRQMQNKSFLATPLGPDQQLLWGKFGRTFMGDTLGADMNFWLRRSGERHCRDTVYTITNLNNTRKDKQPYGIVEDEIALWASVSYKRYFVEAELRGGATMYKNRGNIEADGWESYPFFGIFLTSGISSGVKPAQPYEP